MEGVQTWLAVPWRAVKGGCACRVAESKFLSVILAISVPQLALALTMEMVTVGNTNNPADSTGHGAVGYSYEIGKCEVKNEEYVQFLNKVARTDKYRLYNWRMTTNSLGGISRSGSSGAFTYSAKTNMGKKPVNFVSFYSAARFVNWLQNGQPSGLQQAGTTETGSYTLFTDGDATTNVSRRSFGPAWVLPSQDEWYKAAYHHPAASGGPSDSYWRYPTRSDSNPTIATANASGDINNPGPDVANYDMGADWNGEDGNVTTVSSAGPLSASYYGTFDQGGNVWEWTGKLFLKPHLYRVAWGGYWMYHAECMASDNWNYFPHPEDENDGLGFRVARIPRLSPDAPSLDVQPGIADSIQLTLKGGIGCEYEIETSDTLTNWTLWLSRTMVGTMWSTNVPANPDIVRRFWRSRLAP